jgi:dienelactone hydrolase
MGQRAGSTKEKRMKTGQRILERSILTLLVACSASTGGGPADEAAANRGQAHVSHPLTIATHCRDSIDSVYAVPSDLPPYAASHRGDVVRCARDRTFSVEEIETRLAADGFIDAEVRGPVRVYRVAYRTERLAGEEGLTSALVLLPDWPLTAAPPLVVFAHGLEGIDPECSVSKGDWTKAPYRRVGSLLALASYGYPIIAPDYAGFMPGSAPGGAFLSEDEAHSVLDGTRAVSKLLRPGATNDRVVLVGHSQGGHAVLSAQALAGSYGLTGRLAGVMAFAPNWIPAQTWGLAIARELGLNTTDDSSTLRLAMIYFYTHAELYDGPGSGLALFQSGKRSLVESYLAACPPTPSVVPLAALGRTASDFFEPAFVDSIGSCALGNDVACATEPAPTWLPRFRADRPRLDVQGADVVMWLGAEDEALTPELAQCGIDKINEDFSSAETTATFTVCGDRKAAHETVLSRNMSWAAQWIASQTGSAPEPAACAGRSELLPENGDLACSLPGNTD